MTEKEYLGLRGSSMTSEQMQELFETSDRVVGEVPLGFHRYLHGEIDWRDRLICRDSK